MSWSAQQKMVSTRPKTDATADATAAADPGEERGIDGVERAAPCLGERGGAQPEVTRAPTYTR